MICKIFAFLLLPYLVISFKMDKKPVFKGELVIGPNDVGGQCPSSTYQYNAPGICRNGCCCCGPNCCWDKCDYAPEDCIKDVENSEWRYVKELGYYRVITKSGKLMH